VVGGAVFVRVTTTVFAGCPVPAAEHAGRASSRPTAHDRWNRRRSTTDRR